VDRVCSCWARATPGTARARAVKAALRLKRGCWSGACLWLWM